MVKNIAVMASGGGSNFENLAVKSDFLNMKIKVLIIDSPEIYAAERAERLKIPCRIVNRQDFKSKREFEAGIMSALADFEIDYIVLAGFMRILSADFINRYENKIINLHPSLLPAFKGKNGIEDAFNYGVKVTGVTVHFVDAGIDTGKIIDQTAVIIEDGDTLATLEEKIHQTEYELYPAALKKVFDGRV
ncbi:MAG TPA: phosphoribosylglycinamide formyltransferase [Jeotgalicoccus aerolatus]|nr:phosphoribosylglycinamide formyltransferase [Jeotgalicoccus aerolatus]HJG33837.1 phosphoribosylglycinamide formyltransferase [Jeotgalicoccus aerolatus]